MTISVTPPNTPSVPPSRRHRLLERALNPSVVFVTAAITGVTLAIVAAMWIGVNEPAWRSIPACDQHWAISDWVSRATAVAAVGSLGALGASSLWLGTRGAHRARTAVAFWSIVAVAWLVVGVLTGSGQLAHQCIPSPVL